MNAFDRFFPSSTVIFIGGLISCGLLTFVCWNAVQIEDQKKALLVKEQKLDKDKADFEASIALYPHIKNELPRLKVQYDTVNAEVKEIVYRHETKLKELSETKKQLQSTHETFNDVTTKLDKNIKQLANTKSLIADGESRRSILADEISSLQREKTRLERLVDPLSTKVRNLEAELKNLENDHATATASKRTLEQELRVLEGNLSAKRESLTRLSEEDGKLTLIVEQTRPLLEQLSKANSTANELLESLKKGAEGIAKSDSALGSQVTAFARTVSQTQEHSSKMAETEKELRNETLKLDNVLTSLNTASSNVEKTTSSITAQQGAVMKSLQSSSDAVEKAASSIVVQQEKTLASIAGQVAPIMEQLDKSRSASEATLTELAKRAEGIAGAEKSLNTQLSIFTQAVDKTKDQSAVLESVNKNLAIETGKTAQVLSSFDKASAGMEKVASSVSSRNEKVLNALDKAEKNLSTAVQSVKNEALEIDKAQKSVKSSAEQLEKTVVTFASLSTSMENSRKNLNAGFHTLEQLQKKLQANLSRLEKRQGLKIATDLEKALSDVVGAAAELKEYCDSMSTHSGELLKALSAYKQTVEPETNAPVSAPAQ